MAQLLIIDDEPSICWGLKKLAESLGHVARIASSAEAGFREADKSPKPEAVFLDVRLPGLDGISAMPQLRERLPDAPIIVMTAHGELETAVDAIRNGAFEYLTKPFDLTLAEKVLDRALRRRPQEAVPPAAMLGLQDQIVGHSPALQDVFKQIALVAGSEACVLVSGESGTGKELVARAVHRYSARRDRPFLPVHVAALNPNLVESELFGHVKGAFTGASQTRAGLLALADGGTVFLDEIAEIPLPVQVKLLRVLEQNEITPVGGSQPAPLNVRILAATHQNLERNVAAGTFRNDLFFRLNVFEIHLPPLRQRREDIVPLAEHFLRRFDVRLLPLVPATTDFLTAQRWVGNVRELRNALEHAVIVARGGPLLPEHFPVGAGVGMGTQPGEQLAAAVLIWLEDRVRTAGTQTPTEIYADLLKCVEPPLLEDLMRRLNGNRLIAAQWLGLNRATVRKKLAEYGLANVHRAGSAGGDGEDDGDGSG